MSKTTALRWGNPARNLGYGRAANPAIPLPKRPHEFRQTLLDERRLDMAASCGDRIRAAGLDGSG